MNDKIKILHVVSALDGGGVESLLKNYYDNIDTSKIAFDFIVHNKNIGILEDELVKKGCKIFHVTPKKESFIKNYIEINQIIRNKKYDIIHCHQNFMSFPVLFSAKINGVKVRIIHAHGCDKSQSLILKIKNYILRKVNVKFANYFFACGKSAGEWLYGKNCSGNSKYTIINNAINLDKFKYDFSIRKIKREKLKIEDKIVLLHVGRFSNEKNHEFIVQIIENINKINPNKYILYFAGDGETKENIVKIVHEKKLESVIKFLGNRPDISDLLNMADILLLPSIKEGFGIVTVEAQATGLTVFASTNVPIETKLTQNIYYLHLDEIDKWIEAIISFNSSNRKSYYLKGFSIDEESVKYQSLIMNMINSNK